MTIEEVPDPNLAAHHPNYLLDWLEDSISFLPNFLDEPYAVPDEITGYGLWAQDQEQQQQQHVEVLHTPSPPTPPAAATPTATTATTISTPPLPQPEFAKKRKLPADTQKAAAHHQNRRRTEGGDDGGEREREREGGEDGEANRKAGGGRKNQGKGAGGNSGNGASKEVRWAEQLLNPCTAAIEAANLSRVQHLFYVLHELASPAGDANHRLAAHGLRALARHLSAAGVEIPGRAAGGALAPAPSFAAAEPKLFRSALIKFHEVSPWFAFPNCLANASILHALQAPDPTTTPQTQQRPRALHVVDVGVSHGVQWPTLLEALTRRPGGAPPLVRLTLPRAPAGGPFAAAPPGYDFPSHLLRYAKSIDLNLRIDRVESLRSESLAAAAGGAGETLVVCVQFRAGHGSAEERTAFLRGVRELRPDLVVLSELDDGGGGGGGGGGEESSSFAAGFARRAELVWRFLDSTSAAFKGRDCAERRLVEGEAARWMEGEMGGEGRERWRERMAGVGLAEEAVGEDAVEAGRALLRKCDGNWEMRAGGPGEVGVGLRWKGHPVSFCSLWKPHTPSPPHRRS